MDGKEYEIMKKLLSMLNLLDDWYAGDIRVERLEHGIFKIKSTPYSERLDNTNVTWQDLEDKWS